MASKPLAIVGIDPGTMTAYAMLDLKGNIIELRSSKLFDLSRLITVVTGKTMPVVVAADKRPTPKFVERFAIKTGARLHIPREQLTVRDKKNLAQGNKTQNTHQMDALAAAVDAYKDYSALLKKTRTVLKREQKEHLLEDVQKLLFQHDRMSIKSAIDALEKPESKPKATKKKADRRPAQKPAQINLSKIYEKYMRLKKDAGLLRGQNKHLKEDKKELLAKIRSRRERKGSTRKDAKRKEQLKQKERKIQELQRQLSKARARLEEKDRRNKELEQAILCLDTYRPIPAISDMGGKAMRRIKELGTRDIVFIRDPSVISARTASYLKRMLDTVIAPRKTKPLEEFHVIGKDELQLKDYGPFIMVERKSLKKALDKRDILGKVMQDYKKEREKELE